MPRRAHFPRGLGFLLSKPKQSQSATYGSYYTTMSRKRLCIQGCVWAKCCRRCPGSRAAPANDDPAHGPEWDHRIGSLHDRARLSKPENPECACVGVTLTCRHNIKSQCATDSAGATKVNADEILFFLSKIICDPTFRPPLADDVTQMRSCM